MEEVPGCEPFVLFVIVKALELFSFGGMKLQLIAEVHGGFGGLPDGVFVGVLVLVV